MNSSGIVQYFHCIHRFHNPRLKPPEIEATMGTLDMLLLAPWCRELRHLYDGITFVLFTSCDLSSPQNPVLWTIYAREVVIIPR